MNQIERIRHMEQNLDESSEAIHQLAEALETYIAAREQISELSAYYGSDDWKYDYDTDCAGKLPPDLKRGVLSQDAVYDLLMEHARLQALLAELAAPKR